MGECSTYNAGGDARKDFQFFVEGPSSPKKHLPLEAQATERYIHEEERPNSYICNWSTLL